MWWVMAESVLFSVQLDRATDDALEEIKRLKGIPKAAYIRLAVMERLEREDPDTLKPKVRRPRPYLD